MRHQAQATILQAAAFWQRGPSWTEKAKAAADAAARRAAAPLFWAAA